jgi:predicted O-methyltransferase YrrM
MKPETVRATLGSLPYMTLEQGKLFHSFIVQRKLAKCLELGFLHGVSSAYIGAAVQELEEGSLITIDREEARAKDPNIEWVIATLGLEKFVKPYFEERSYNWRLMKFLEAGMYESFDFCYIDGAHNWYVDGFAYCLVSRLLRPGGWVVFDDLNWVFEKNSIHLNAEWVKTIPAEEKNMAQVGKIFELLVKADPFFGEFHTVGRQFGFAQKTRSVWSGRPAESGVGSSLQRLG